MISCGNSSSIQLGSRCTILCDSVLHAVAEAEVVLPINEQVEDSSTIAPEVNDGIIDREKALRFDDEIMNFQWISTIPWSDIKDLRGSSYVQPLARLRCALQQTQHAILRAILHHGSSSRGSQPAWKVVLLSSSWVQPRTQQTAIGPVSWKHDWTSSGLRTRQRLWTMVRAECDATTITQASSEGQRRTNRRSQDPQKDALARAGERDAARNAAPVPVTSEIVWKIKGLHSIDPDPAPATTQISHIFIARIAEFKPHATPLRTRPSGMRAEHWDDFGTRLGTPTCSLLSLLPSPLPPCQTRSFNTCALVWSRPFSNPHKDTDHSS